MKKSILFGFFFLVAIYVKSQDVKIGAQIWATKNIDVTKYRNGDIIPEVKDAKKWSNIRSGAWCYYENKTTNGTIYGKLYNWYAVNDPRGLAPDGYHIPNDTEWETLIKYLGGDSIAATKLKNNSGWESYYYYDNNGEKIGKLHNGIGTNESGFIGLPGGARFENGTFDYIGNYGNWWISSGSDPGFAWSRYLGSKYGEIYGNEINSHYGFSVRCIKD